MQISRRRNSFGNVSPSSAGTCPDPLRRTGGGWSRAGNLARRLLREFETMTKCFLREGQARGVGTQPVIRHPFPVMARGKRVSCLFRGGPETYSGVTAGLSPEGLAACGNVGRWKTPWPVLNWQAMCERQAKCCWTIDVRKLKNLAFLGVFFRGRGRVIAALAPDQRRDCRRVGTNTGFPYPQSLHG